MFRILARQCLHSPKLRARCPPVGFGASVPSRRESTTPEVRGRRRYIPYTEPEDDLIVRLRTEGQTWATIAAKLDRATASVRERGKHLDHRILKRPSISAEEIYARKKKGENVEAIARELGTTIWTVNYRLRQAELNGYVRKYSDEELRKMKQLVAEGATFSHVARVLGKSIYSVKRQFYGLSKIPRQQASKSSENRDRKPWTETEVEEALRMSREGIPRKQIAKALGRSPAAVSNRFVSFHVVRGTTFYKNQRLSPPELRQLVQLREKDRLSFRELAHHFPHRCPSTLCKAYNRLKREKGAAG